jgi:hypothetical protein
MHALFLFFPQNFLALVDACKVSAAIFSGEENREFRS